MSKSRFAESVTAHPNSSPSYAIPFKLIWQDASPDLKLTKHHTHKLYRLPKSLFENIPPLTLIQHLKVMFRTFLKSHLAHLSNANRCIKPQTLNNLQVTTPHADHNGFLQAESKKANIVKIPTIQTLELAL